MHKAGVLADKFGQMGEEGDDVVLGDGLDLIDSGDVEFGLRSFVPDKTFTFTLGELTVANEGSIPLAKLSSGEKQLLILFIEALLQRQQPYIFLADEPELSLHISWQRNIVSAIRSLNPNAQIVVATHSPEIAGKYKNRILDMEDILHA